MRRRAHPASRRLRRWAVGVALAVVAGASALFFIAVTLARASPTWWRTVVHDGETARLAEDIEASVGNGIYRVRPADPGAPEGPYLSEPWSLEVGTAEANAWLNIQLPKWLANNDERFRWPSEVSELQVDFNDKQIRIGARVRAAGQDQVLAATLTPDLKADGSLWLPAQWVSVGRLGVPASWILDNARRNSDDFIPGPLLALPETDAMFQAFSGRAPAMRNAVIRLGDGRRVRVLSVVPRDGMLRITCRTEQQ